MSHKTHPEDKTVTWSVDEKAAVINYNDIFVDPFDDFSSGKIMNTIQKEKDKEIHLRIQKRSGRRFITLVEGLNKNLDLKKIVSFWKKEFCCTGSIKKIQDTDDYIVSLTGDQRQLISSFLIEQEIASKHQIIIHGY